MHTHFIQRTKGGFQASTWWSHDLCIHTTFKFVIFVKTRHRNKAPASSARRQKLCLTKRLNGLYDWYPVGMTSNNVTPRKTIMQIMLPSCTIHATHPFHNSAWRSCSKQVEVWWSHDLLCIDTTLCWSFLITISFQIYDSLISKQACEEGCIVGSSEVLFEKEAACHSRLVRKRGLWKESSPFFPLQLQASLEACLKLYVQTAYTTYCEVYQYKECFDVGLPFWCRNFYLLLQMQATVPSYYFEFLSESIAMCVLFRTLHVPTKVAMCVLFRTYSYKFEFVLTLALISYISLEFCFWRPAHLSIQQTYTPIICSSMSTSYTSNRLLYPCFNSCFDALLLTPMLDGIL